MICSCAPLSLNLWSCLSTPHYFKSHIHFRSAHNELNTFTIATAAEIGSRIPSTVQTRELSEPAGMIPSGILRASSASSRLKSPLSTCNHHSSSKIHGRQMFAKPTQRGNRTRMHDNMLCSLRHWRHKLTTSQQCSKGLLNCTTEAQGSCSSTSLTMPSPPTQIMPAYPCLLFSISVLTTVHWPYNLPFPAIGNVWLQVVHWIEFQKQLFLSSGY